MEKHILEFIIKEELPLHMIWWKDPDPIPGSDYTIYDIREIDYEAGTCLIQYGRGSESRVFIDELQFDYKKRQLVIIKNKMNKKFNF